MTSSYIYKYKLKKKNLYSIGVDFQKLFFKKNTNKNKLRFIFFKRFYKKLFKKYKKKIHSHFKKSIYFLIKKYNNVNLKLKIKNIKSLTFKQSYKNILKQNLKQFYETKMRLKPKKYVIRLWVAKLLNNFEWKNKKLSFRLRLRNRVINKEYSKLFSFKPKEKFIRYKKARKGSRNSIVTFKGQFFKFLQFKLYYGCISLKNLKKLQKKYKYNYYKNSLFSNYFNFKLKFFLYEIGLFKKILTSYLYIKKKGIIINFFLTKNPLEYIKPGDLLEFSWMLKVLFLKNIIKRRMRFFNWLRKLPYTLIINYKIVVLTICNVGKININSFERWLKKRVKRAKNYSSSIFYKFIKY